MNEALRLRDAEGQSMTRRRSDSNPILLAAGLRETSQRSNTVARLSPVTARRSGETPVAVPAARRSPESPASDAPRRTASSGHSATLTHVAAASVLRGDSTSPAPDGDQIAALIDNVADEARAEVERNAQAAETLNSPKESAKEQGKEGGSRAMKKLNRLTAAFKKSPTQERPVFERHNTLDMPTRVPSNSSESAAAGDDNAEALLSPKGSTVAAPGEGDAADTTEDTSQEPADSANAPMCERCKQRKAKARVTMPDGVQSLMCRRCTGEVQRISSSGKQRKSKRPPTSSGDKPSNDNTTL